MTLSEEALSESTIRERCKVSITYNNDNNNPCIEQRSIEPCINSLSLQI